MQVQIILMRLAAATALLATPWTAHSSESLYDPTTAHSVPEKLQPRLGPKSASLNYDQRMIRAAEMAVKRAHAQTTWHCWRYVKNALLEAGVVASRPASAWAKEAGEELCARYGFTKLKVKNPYDAPVGAVIVYGGPDAGHVELRSSKGFVSDFVSPTPYPRPLVGIFIKPS